MVRPGQGRNAGEDDARISRLQCLVVESKAGLHVWAKVFHQNISPLYKAVKNCSAFVAAQVERYAAFIAVLVLEVRFVSPGKVFRITRPLDTDDVGSPVRKLA